MITTDILTPPYGLEGVAAYADLRLDMAEVYRQMGCGDAAPDADVEAETLAVAGLVEAVARPRFRYFITEGSLDDARGTLTIDGTELSVGRVIGRQLRGSEAFALFVATAGAEFEELQFRLKDDDDMVRTFIADSFGSVIAELTADMMERSLQSGIAARGWHHTNRFSPGYCGWHVSGQQQLFSLFADGRTCGVRLTESSLMLPIKSVSGVIGLGSGVRRLDYSCGLCGLTDCYKRKNKIKN